MNKTLPNPTDGTVTKILKWLRFGFRFAFTWIALAFLVLLAVQKYQAVTQCIESTSRKQIQEQ